MGEVILKDTTLCAIVRDEKVNPAGGIQRFVESHTPFVEEAVIVDTGSIDGTREILEEMNPKYSNLKIFDYEFDGFANARNYSLSNVKTKYVLVLDADELLTHEKPTNDFKIIQEFIERYHKSSNHRTAYFDFLHIFPSGISTLRPEHNERFFQPKFNHYEGSVFECLSFWSDQEIQIKCKIKHFLPGKDALGKKERDYYNNIINGQFIKGIPPSRIEGFSDWKKYNPQRDRYN
jgi:glycosyltransferase involved in cell wall biosynthesis